MAQSSGPISQGTTAERQMTDVMWRDLFGDEPGVFGDTDGSAYTYYAVPDTNTVNIGSLTIPSLARVAGFYHRIPANLSEQIDVPAATGSARTDIISLRYDPAYTSAPGPVRLFRIAGTSATVPSYDATAPGVEDLPLYSVARQPGQSLAQAVVTPMFPRATPQLMLRSATAPLPLSSPIGTRLRRGNVDYIRTFDTGGNPVWTPDPRPLGILHTPITPGVGDFGTSNGSWSTLATTPALTIPENRRLRVTVAGRVYNPYEGMTSLRFVRNGTTAFGEVSWWAGPIPEDLAPVHLSRTDAPAAGTVTYSLQGRGPIDSWFDSSPKEFYVEDIGAAS